jgi:hypothetical protein
MDDFHNYRRKLERYLDSLKTFPDGNLIADYAHSLDARGLNKGRIAKAVYQLKMLRSHLPCS